jgi:hypothetical protein
LVKKLYSLDLEKKKKAGTDLFGNSDIYYPIQAKQKDKAGRPDINSFETAIRRNGRRKGYFILFDFSSDAIKEIQRLIKTMRLKLFQLRLRIY